MLTLLSLIIVDKWSVRITRLSNTLRIIILGDDNGIDILNHTLNIVWLSFTRVRSLIYLLGFVGLYVFPGVTSLLYMVELQIDHPNLVFVFIIHFYISYQILDITCNKSLSSSTLEVGSLHIAHFRDFATTSCRWIFNSSLTRFTVLVY